VSEPFPNTADDHTCSTYNEQPTREECPAHQDGWQEGARSDSLRHPLGLWCFEHHWHETPGELHDECEACEAERLGDITLSDAELATLASGARCDAHLTDDPDDI
jgi:hypothetical protein